MVPLCINSPDPNEIEVPNSILTHRFSVCLHVFLSHLKFDQKNKIFFIEAKNTLGTPECQINSIIEPYTSDLIEFRVINDIYRQDQILNSDWLKTGVSANKFLFTDTVPVCFKTGEHGSIAPRKSTKSQ